MAMPKQLERSYLSGKVAARVKWKTGGDFTRCVSQARRHGMNGPMAKGACAKLHKKATGVWPGDKRNLSSGRGKKVKR
jgi:hypothetical protein